MEKLCNPGRASPIAASSEAIDFCADDTALLRLAMVGLMSLASTPLVVCARLPICSDAIPAF